MKNWLMKNLGDAILAEKSLDHIKTLFMTEYEQAGNVTDMAIFYCHASEGDLHCEVKVYFSPASASVAKAVAATKCQKPSAAGLGLLAGSEESWSILFPEKYLQTS